jgi:hypothetical protein
VILEHHAGILATGIGISSESDDPTDFYGFKTGSSDLLFSLYNAPFREKKANWRRRFFSIDQENAYNIRIS